MAISRLTIILFLKLAEKIKVMVGNFVSSFSMRISSLSQWICAVEKLFFLDKYQTSQVSINQERYIKQITRFVDLKSDNLLKRGRVLPVA